MSGSEYNVGDLVAEFLERCSVRTAFGIVSIHNIPMLDAIARRNRIRFVMTRGEMGAAHMADGYARVSGGLGVVFSSTGPGAANAVPGLVEARFASTPLLHLTGATPTKFAGRDIGAVHDIPDQIGMLRSVSKAAYTVRTAQEAFGVLARAVTDARTAPMGPVSVEIPIDLQRTPVQRPSELDFLELPSPTPVIPSAAVLDAMAERIVKAKRPMLWLGNGAREAREAALRLLDQGFGMVTSWAGRGVVPEDHPMNLGTFTGNGMPAVQDFYATCDLMIVAGSRQRAHETGDFSIRLPEVRIQIDVDPSANGRTYSNSGFICGDASVTLAGIADRIGGRMKIDPSFQDEFSVLKKSVREQYKQTLGPYAELPSELRAAVPRDAIWARDITISNSTWGNRLFSVYGRRDSVYPMSAGIGQGMPLGIGAAAAALDRKTIILSGDGGFFLNMSELWTAVQEQLNIVLVIMNDKGYGVIRQLQDVTAGGRQFYTDLAGPDLENLAQVAGIPFWRVSKVSDVRETVGQAVAVSGPAMIEVDMTAIGAHPPYYPFNQMKASARA